MDIDFKTATDILGLSATELAKVFGLQVQTIRQMRLRSDAANYRSPPDGWRAVLIHLARRRSKELKELAGDLERGGAGFKVRPR